MTEHAAVVLCGGRSKRMGRSKAWLPWRGVTLLQHLVAVLREVVDEVVVVTSGSLDPPPVDARIVRDVQEDRGPLAAIAQGLAHLGAGTQLAFVTATDAPFLTPLFVRSLLAFGEPVAPLSEGFVQTLCAVYPKAAAGEAHALLAKGCERPLALLEAVGYRQIPSSELPALESVNGFNTPKAYLEAVEADHGPATARLEFLGRARLLAGCESMAVPVGELGDVLAHAPAGLELREGERVARNFLVSLGGRDFVRDARIPIGAGERVIVIDAASGG